MPVENGNGIDADNGICALNRGENQGNCVGLKTRQTFDGEVTVFCAKQIGENGKRRLKFQIAHFFRLKRPSLFRQPPRFVREP